MAVYESKKVTKDGRKYFFRIKYKDIFGTTHDYTSAKYKNKKDAINEEALFRVSVKEKTTSNNITIKNIFTELIATKKRSLKIQTINKNYNLFKHLKLIENKKINDLNLNDYNKLLKYLESLNFTTDYKNKILGLLKQIIVFSNKYYNTDTQILKFIETLKDNKIKKEMLFYTYDEYIKFENVIEDFNWKTFFKTLYYMGLRQGEIQALTWKDINFENKTISINKSLTSKIKGINWQVSTPKTKSSVRTLPLFETVLNDLKTMYNNAQEYKDFSNEWFIFGNSIPYKETTIQAHKNLYCKLANLKQIRVHDFRHSCASFLINKGASITLVSKWLGHSNISMTLNTYTHLYKSELETIVNFINN